MSEQVEAARLIAKLLASRRTRLDEIPGLFDSVQRALAGLGAVKEIAIAPPPPPKQQRKRGRPAALMLPAAPPLVSALQEAAPKALPATLVRRAEVISVAPVAPTVAFIPARNGAVRGVVQWFDSRSGQGTLRLQGFSRDIRVDAAMLAAFGITRLFKGQEIEATIETAGETPKVTGLQLANAAATSLVSRGTVLDRHAKPVVVELKREAQRRGAARAEAELLLPPQRAR